MKKDCPTNYIMVNGVCLNKRNARKSTPSLKFDCCWWSKLIGHKLSCCASGAPPEISRRGGKIRRYPMGGTVPYGSTILQEAKNQLESLVDTGASESVIEDAIRKISHRLRKHMGQNVPESNIYRKGRRVVRSKRGLSVNRRRK